MARQLFTAMAWQAILPPHGKAAFYRHGMAGNFTTTWQGSFIPP
jgi:hypothetical protein